jgi:hypothetical protein
VQETSHLHGLENTDPENDRREKKGKTEEGALRAGANAPTAPPAPASKPQHEAPQNSGGVPQPVETYRAVHRRYPSKKQTAKQREEGLPNDWEQIAAAVLPQEDAAWRAALESWRDTAIEHNLSLALGERRWNPAGVDSALRAFAEAQAVRDYQQRAHAAAQAKPAAEKPAAGGVRSFGSGGVSLNIAAPRQ